MIKGMIVDKSLHTRVLNFKHLCEKDLINDIKEAATCEVHSVCRFVCHRCPSVPRQMDVGKIKLKDLSSHTIQLTKSKSGELLILVTVPGIDHWLMSHDLPFTIPIPKTCKEQNGE